MMFCGTLYTLRAHLLNNWVKWEYDLKEVANLCGGLILLRHRLLTSDVVESIFI